MIAESNLRDDLDKVNEIHKTERVHISVEMPVQTKSFLFWSTYMYGHYNANNRVYLSLDHSNLIPFVFYYNKNTKEFKKKVNWTLFRREKNLDSDSSDLLNILCE